MLIVECPFCEAPAFVDEAAGAIVCEPCAVTLPIGDEPMTLELPAAA